MGRRWRSAVRGVGRSECARGTQKCKDFRCRWNKRTAKKQLQEKPTWLLFLRRGTFQAEKRNLGSARQTKCSRDEERKLDEEQAEEGASRISSVRKRSGQLDVGYVCGPSDATDVATSSRKRQKGKMSNEDCH